MTEYALYRNPLDEYVSYVPSVDVAAGTPVEISLDWWGVSANPITANTRGSLRVTGQFLGLKVNPTDSFEVGDLLDFNGTGFVAGSLWRCVEDSPIGAAHVDLEINVASSGGGGGAAVEVVRQSGILTGGAPIDAKLGLNEDTGQVFFKNAADQWDQVAGSSRVVSGKLSATNVSSNGIDVPGLPAVPSVLALIIISTQWDAAELTIIENRISWSGTTLQTDNRLTTGDPYTIIWEP